MTVDYYVMKLGVPGPKSVFYISASESYCSLVLAGLMDEKAWDDVYEAVTNSREVTTTGSTRAERAEARERRCG